MSQLARAYSICLLGGSFLGPNRKWKRVIGERSDTLTCDPLVVLSIVDGSIADILRQVFTDFRLFIGSGTTLFMALMAQLCKECFLLVQNGFDPIMISDGLSHASKKCINYLSVCDKMVFECIEEIPVSIGRGFKSKLIAGVSLEVCRHMRGIPSEWDLGSILTHNAHGSSVDVLYFNGLLIPIEATECVESSCGKVGLLNNNVDEISLRSGSEAIRNLNPTKVIFSAAGMSETNSYIYEKLHSASIVLLVCTGFVNQGIQEKCWCDYGIRIVSYARMREIEALSRYFGLRIFSDFEQLVNDHSQPQVDIKTFVVDGSSHFLHLDIHGANYSFLQRPSTVLFVSPIPIVNAELKRNMFSCIYRIRNVLIKGGGVKGGLAYMDHMASYLDFVPIESVPIESETLFLTQTRKTVFQAFSNALRILSRTESGFDETLDDLLSIERILMQVPKVIHQFMCI